MPIKERITYRKALNSLKKAVAERGEDHIYKKNRKKKFCAYFDSETGTPSCGVGLALSYRGLKFSDIANQYTYGGSPLNYAGSRNLISVLSKQDAYFTPRAQHLLDAFQNAQDRGIKWGEALNEAIRKSKSTPGD